MAYKTNFLKQVIFNANYKTIDSLKSNVNDGLSQEFSDITRVPISETKNFNINILPDLKSSQSVDISWLFKGNDLQIRINKSSIQVINLKYKSHADFHPVIERIIKKLIECYHPFITTTSFRYINIIGEPDGNPFELDNLIDRHLLEPSLKFKDKNLQRSVGTMMLKDNDDVNTKFTYGFFNSEFPGKIAKKEFVLDYDSSLVINSENPNVSDIIKKLRANINSLFEHSISEGLRAKMNE